MTGTISAPLYLLRGLQLIGWRDMQHALDYLYADGALREGTLVAINAEKMLAAEAARFGATRQAVGSVNAARWR